MSVTTVPPDLDSKAETEVVFRRVVRVTTQLVDELMRLSGRDGLPDGLDKAVASLANHIAEVTLAWIGELS
jgi:hypothetical protein